MHIRLNANSDPHEIQETMRAIEQHILETLKKKGETDFVVKVSRPTRRLSPGQISAFQAEVSRIRAEKIREQGEQEMQDTMPQEAPTPDPAEIARTRASMLVEREHRELKRRLSFARRCSFQVPAYA